MNKIVVFEYQEDFDQQNSQYSQYLRDLKAKQKERRQKRKIERRKQQLLAQKAKNHLFNTII